MDAAMAALDEDSSGTVSFGEFQTWWDAQDQTAQNALTTQLKKENEQLTSMMQDLQIERKDDDEADAKLDTNDAEII